MTCLARRQSTTREAIQNLHSWTKLPGRAAFGCDKGETDVLISIRLYFLLLIIYLTKLKEKIISQSRFIYTF